MQVFDPKTIVWAQFAERLLARAICLAYRLGWQWGLYRDTGKKGGYYYKGFRVQAPDEPLQRRQAGLTDPFEEPKSALLKYVSIFSEEQTLRVRCLEKTQQATPGRLDYVIPLYLMRYHEFADDRLHCIPRLCSCVLLRDAQLRLPFFATTKLRWPPEGCSQNHGSLKACFGAT